MLSRGDTDVRAIRQARHSKAKSLSSSGDATDKKQKPGVPGFRA
jgi:hypothetical protein